MVRTAIVICVLALFLHYAVCDINEILEKCRGESAFNGHPKDIKVEGATKEEKCFLKCIMESKGALRKDGTYDVESSKASIAATKGMPDAIKEKIMKAIEECGKEVKPDATDLCETAYKYFQCKSPKIMKV